MKYFLDLMFSGFWSFLGGLIIIESVLKVAYLIYDRTLTYLTVRKRGYPPEYMRDKNNA
jgi:hypothetical protein